MIFRTTCAALIAAGSALGEPALTCLGSAPDWRLELDSEEARFEYLRSTEMTVPQSSRAEGRDWPRAYTLIAEFDTAILLADQTACSLNQAPYPITAHVLTQRGQTPILLTGCCRIDHE